MTDSPDHPDTLAEARINRALGLFLVFFAAVLLVAIGFTETAAGKWTNLAASLILGAIGGGMIWHSGRKRAPRDS